MEAKAMERIRPILEAGDAIILAIMALFTYLKKSIDHTGRIDWTKALVKVFTNFVAGWGFYYALISYWVQLSELPQKVPAIMVATYAGSRMIDVVVDWLYTINIREAIKRWMNF